MWLKFLKFCDFSEHGRHFGPFYEGLTYKVDPDVAAKLIEGQIAVQTEPPEKQTKREAV